MPSTEALARRIARGDVLPHTALFDAGTARWALAGESPLVRFVVEEICRDRQEPLPGWPLEDDDPRPLEDPGPQVGPGSLDFGLTVEDPPDDLSVGADLPSPSDPHPETPVDRIQPSVAPRSPGGLLELDPEPSPVAKLASVAKPAPAARTTPGTDAAPRAGSPASGRARPSAAERSRRFLVLTFGQVPRRSFLIALLVAVGTLAGAHTLGDRARMAEQAVDPAPRTLPTPEPMFMMEGVTTIALPPETGSPTPPAPSAPLEETRRPADPVLPDLQIDPGVAPTILSNDLLDNLVLPPPSPQGPLVVADQPTFTAFEVAPEIRNRDQVRQALQREYPLLLRNAGIGGVVDVWFHIDEEGVVQATVVNRSSGHPELDEAALRMAGVFEFTPALHLGERVAVWVSLPITFEGR